VTDYPGRPFTRTRARLKRTLKELLDDGTGTICPELQPLADSLLAMPKPDRALNWLHNNPRLPGYLQALAHGKVPLTHDGLHSLDSWRTAAHLRDLLMACGTLPPVNRQIMLFEGWDPATPDRPRRRSRHPAAAPVRHLATTPPAARRGATRAAVAGRPQLRRRSVRPSRAAAHPARPARPGPRWAAGRRRLRHCVRELGTDRAERAAGRAADRWNLTG